jgi:hypothetical protein
MRTTIEQALLNVYITPSLAHPSNYADVEDFLVELLAMIHTYQKVFPEPCELKIEEKIKQLHGVNYG